MSQKSALYALFAATLFLFLSPDIWAAEPVEFAAGEILLKFKDGVAEAQQEQILNQYVLEKKKYNSSIQTHLVLAKEDDITIKVSLLNQESAIEYAQPNYVKKPDSAPNDPFYNTQWYLPHIGMLDAWSQFTGSTIVKVAVIDSGVNKSLADLSAVLISDGEWDYISADNDATDTDGHGTLISGIIAATANNGIGVAGISSTARILPFRQDGFISDINDAMVRSYNAGCRIINASYGNGVENPAEKAQISWLNERGVLVVCSAGNSSSNNDTSGHFPASYALPNIISVMSSTSSSNRDSSSNYGQRSVDIAAPGVNICSTLGVGEKNRLGVYGFPFDAIWGYSKALPNGFTWQYNSDGSVGLQSNVLDLRDYVNTQISIMVNGGLAVGEFLGVRSGTTTLVESTQNALVRGDIVANYTSRTTAIDQALGRIWFCYASKPLSDRNIGLLGSDISGIPLYSFRDTSPAYRVGSASGTSYAAPVVTGVAAMLMSQCPNFNHIEIKDIILKTVKKEPGLSRLIVSEGIVDASAALREAKIRYEAARVPPSITSSSSSTGSVGSFFKYTIAALRSPSSYAASGLPDGLTINTFTGTISGVPKVAGTSNVLISATNMGGTDTASVTVVIEKGEPQIGGATYFTLYGLPLMQDAFTTYPPGSSVPGRFSWVTPSLIPPLGSSLQSAIFTPTDTVNYNTVTFMMYVQTSDLNPASITISISGVGSQTFSLSYGRVSRSLSFSGEISGYSVSANSSYTINNSNSVDVGGFTLSTQLGSIEIPRIKLIRNGNTYTASRKIAFGGKTPTVSVSIRDDMDNNGNRIPDFSDLSMGNPIIISSDLSPVAIPINASYSYQLTTSGSPTSFRAKGLPAGLKINGKTGLISGVPSKGGRFQVVLEAVRDGATFGWFYAKETKILTVLQVATFTYTATINATKGKALNVAPKIAGYPAPTFSILTGSLPPGLSLNASTAAITGTPTAIGTYPFTVRGSNSAGNTDRSATIVVK
jgi:thermitase